MNIKNNPQHCTGAAMLRPGQSTLSRPAAARLSRTLRFSLPLLILLLPACAAQPQAAPTAAPTDTVLAPYPPADLGPTPEPTPAPTAAPALPAPLSAEGPWIIVNTANGLWAANPDGSGASLLTPGRVLIPGAISRAVSPNGGYVAYLSSSDLSAIYGNYPDLNLNILGLPGPGTAAVIPLTSPKTEGADEFPSEVIRAMTEHTPFAWSKDGSRLAYIGAAQGPSADLYEYIFGLGETLRLTDGPDQAYDPLWSPDGKWIVQIAAAGFGTGAGISDSGIYAARADNSGVITLYDIPAHSGGETEIGWLNSHTLVTQSWLITCGPSDIRLSDLSTNTANRVFQGCVSAAAAGPGVGSLLFAQSSDTAAYDSNPQPGLYLVTDSNRVPQRISEEDFREIVWSEGAGAFLARTTDSRLYEVSRTGNMVLLGNTAPQIPLVSPDGRYWATTAPMQAGDQSGLWIGQFKTEIPLIFSGEVMFGQILFAPAGDSVYFFDSDGNLYRAQAPEWKPALIAPSLTPDVSDVALAWVEK